MWSHKGHNIDMWQTVAWCSTAIILVDWSIPQCQCYINIFWEMFSWRHFWQNVSQTTLSWLVCWECMMVLTSQSWSLKSHLRVLNDLQFSAHLLLMTPFFFRSGLYTSVGTRTPPSNKVDLVPRKGKLLPPLLRPAAPFCEQFDRKPWANRKVHWGKGLRVSSGCESVYVCVVHTIN